MNYFYDVNPLVHNILYNNRSTANISILILERINGKISVELRVYESVDESMSILFCISKIDKIEFIA